MAGQIEHALAEANWSSLRELADNLEVGQEYIGLRGAGSAQAPVEVEGRVRRGLKGCIGNLNSSINDSRKELKAIEPKIQELTEAEHQFKSERRNAFKQMVQGHMKRVGAPLYSGVTDIDEGLAWPMITLEATAESFNAFYQQQRGQRTTLPEWTCTEEDALRPEKDLLGMCPGGKPHLTDEQLEARKEKKCMCMICVADRKLSENVRRLKPLKPKQLKLRETIREQSGLLVAARRLVPRFRSGGGAVGVQDPVFYGEDANFDESDGEDQLVVHQHAQAEWSRLECTLQVSDFPLRLVFLDKSGSMGCDSICYEALQLGLHNSLNPTRGSTLTFLFAAPGETQMLLRRPGDEPITFDLELGCATWFNEPILRTLRFLAPVVERLDTQAWIRDYGEPPLQVLCLTDGADNQSSEEVRTLSGLVRELKDIVGPVSGEKLYVPIPGPLKKHTALFDENCKQIPVWLAWIACGMGGQALLGSKGPKEICMVDAIAVPQLREPDNLALRDEPDQRSEEQDEDKDEQGSALHCASSTVASRARRRMHSSSCSGALSAGVDASTNEWRVGHRVRVRASAPGRAPKAALVLSTSVAESGKLEYELLFDDETTMTVDASQLLGVPATPTTLLRLQVGQRPKGVQAERGIFARTAEPDEQRLQVLSVVNEMTQDLASVMRKKSSKTNKVSLEEAMRLVSGGENVSDESASALEAAIGVAQGSCNVANLQHTPPCEPSELLQEALLDIGRYAARLIPEDRLVAQRLISVGLEMLVSGGSVMPAHISDQLGPFVGLQEANAMRRLPNRGDAELEAWRKTVSQPLDSLLSFLANKGLLEAQSAADGETYQAVQEALPCLAAVWRYMDPASNRSGFEDALRRAVNRFQRTRRSFTFGGSSSSFSLDATSPLASTPSAVERSSLPALSSLPAQRPSSSQASIRSPSCGTRQPSKEVATHLVRSPSCGSQHPSKEIATCSPSRTRLGSRTSTPGSVASSSVLPELSFRSGASNCSTSPSESQREPQAKNSLLAAAGNRLVSRTP